MRVERLRLRLIRLPLVAFFETSLERVYDKTFILVSVESDGVEGLGRIARDDQLVLQDFQRLRGNHVNREK